MADHALEISVPSIITCWRARSARPKDLRLIPGATHLFEEAGALPEVARLAREWFESFLRPAAEIRSGFVGS